MGIEPVPGWHLAQLNVARMLAPMDSPQLADFVANLDRINALADTAPGFVWRLQSEEGDATSIRYFGDDMLVNMSVWESVEALQDFVYRSGHVEIMRRRRDWFAKMDDAYVVLWWVPAGDRPTLEEADGKLRLFRERGASAAAFSFRQQFPAPAGRLAAG